MSFVLTCPHCGVREVSDFAFGGEVSRRPGSEPTFRELCEYNYFRRNVAGLQREWWYHRSGCRAWFQAERDTRSNAVLRVGLPGEFDDEGEAAAAPRPPATDGPLR
jgi:sarcosine oxidase subunit delta